MKPFTLTDGREGLIVEVPKEASDLVWPKIGIVDLYFHREGNHLEEESYISVSIPIGPWQILADTDSMSEEVAATLVPKYLLLWIGVENSFQALARWIKSLCLDPTKRHLVLIKG